MNNEIEYETKNIYPKDDIILTQEQKDFVDQSVSDGMTCAQAAAVLFPEVRVTHTSKEYQAVFEYVDKNDEIICFDLLRHALNKFELVFKKSDAIVLQYCIIFKQV